MSQSGTVQEQVLERAIKDESFRQEVLNNPRTVLAREYNVHIPETVSIRVVEDTSNTLTIALPPKQDSMQSLSDAELESVAGGGVRITWSLVCTFGKGCNS